MHELFTAAWLIITLKITDTITTVKFRKRWLSLPKHVIGTFYLHRSTNQHLLLYLCYTVTSYLTMAYKHVIRIHLAQLGAVSSWFVLFTVIWHTLEKQWGNRGTLLPRKKCEISVSNSMHAWSRYKSQVIQLSKAIFLTGQQY
jgi:hypothetical protein